MVSAGPRSSSIGVESTAPAKEEVLVEEVVTEAVVAEEVVAEVTVVCWAGCERREDTVVEPDVQPRSVAATNDSSPIIRTSPPARTPDPTRRPSPFDWPSPASTHPSRRTLLPHPMDVVVDGIVLVVDRSPRRSATPNSSARFPRVSSNIGVSLALASKALP